MPLDCVNRLGRRLASQQFISATQDCILERVTMTTESCKKNGAIASSRVNFSGNVAHVTIY